MASSTALRNDCVSAALLAIEPNTESSSIAIGMIVSSACLLEAVRIASELAAAAGRRRGAAEGYAPAGGAVAAVLDDDASVEAVAADLAAARAASSSW